MQYIILTLNPLQLYKIYIINRNLLIKSKWFSYLLFRIFVSNKNINVPIRYNIIITKKWCMKIKVDI